MINDKFILPYINFIQEKFDRRDHLFYIIGGKEYEKIKPDKNIIYYGKKISIKFVKILYILWAYFNLYSYAIKSKKIMLHGIFNPVTIIFFYFNPWFLKKCNWIIWGGDLYSYRTRKYDSILKKNFYKMEDFVKKNMANISYLVEEDYNIAQKYFKVKGRPQKAIYINIVDMESLDKYEKIYKNNKILNIQIGNSADPENNHVEILNILKKYKKENIKIYAPLSYGNRNYALKIKEYGEKIFKDKFVGMLEYMNPEKYSKYLCNIDILIFNHKRQQGLGNILSLGYLNKKIYIRRDISTWNYLTKDLNLEVYNIEEIINQKFEEFKQNNIIQNKEKIKNTVYSKDYIKNIWELNFNN